MRPRRHPRADVHSDATDIAPDELALPGVEPGPDGQPEQAGDRVADGACAPDRSGRAVECREKAVADALDLPAPEAVQLVPDHRVVALQQVPPPPVAQLGGPL